MKIKLYAILSIILILTTGLAFSLTLSPATVTKTDVAQPASATNDVTLIVLLSNTPANLYTEVREKADAKFSEINTLQDQVRTIYANNRGNEISVAVQSQVTPLVTQIKNLKSQRAAYITSLLHEALDALQENAANRILAIGNTTVIYKDVVLNSLSVKTTKDNIAKIRALPEVSSAEIEAEGIPFISNSAQALKLRDGYYSPNVVWPQGSGLHGEGQAVLIIDTGIRSDHPTAFLPIKGSKLVTTNYDGSCYADCPASYGACDHGTQVSGIIVSQYSTYHGMSYGLDKYYSANVTSSPSCGSLNWTYTMNAYEWAAQGGSGYNDAEVINYSAGAAVSCSSANGLDSYSAYVDNTTDLYDVIWSIAAGNIPQGCSGNYIRDKPQPAYNGVTVSSIVGSGGGGCEGPNTPNRNDDYHWANSKYGPVYGANDAEERLKPDISVPSSVITPDTGDWYNPTTGATSLAAPHYTGLAAVLMQASGFGSKEIRALTFATAEDWGNGTGPTTDGPDYYTGFGYADAWEAYSHIADTYSGRLYSTGDSNFYRIANVQAGDRVVLVYNKHGAYGAPKISNLDLKIYDETTGALLHQTTKVYENKEYWQFTSADAGKNVIIKVVATQIASGLSYDDYAISANTTMTHLDKPTYTITINTNPATIKQYDVVEITVDVKNNGDFAVDDTTNVDITLPANWQLINGADPQFIGPIDAGQTKTATFAVLVKVAGSNQIISANVSGTNYGETFAGSSQISKNVAATTILTHPSQVNKGDIFNVDASYKNNSPKTYANLQFEVKKNNNNISLNSGYTPKSPGQDLTSGNTKNYQWKYTANTAGNTMLWLTVTFTYNGVPVTFDTPQSQVTIIAIAPQAPILDSPSNNYNFKLGETIQFKWHKNPPITSPDNYWFRVYVNGDYYGTQFGADNSGQQRGFNLGTGTYFDLGSALLELYTVLGIADGEITWQIGYQDNPIGTIYWSPLRKINKKLAATLTSPVDGSTLAFDGGLPTSKTWFYWNAVNVAWGTTPNYILKLTGGRILESWKNCTTYNPCYVPLGKQTSFVLTKKQVTDLLDPLEDYQWSISATSKQGTNMEDPQWAKLYYSSPLTFWTPAD